jgi:hypothetical protein
MDYTQLRSKLQCVLREAATSHDGTATLRTFMTSLGDPSITNETDKDNNMDALAHAFQLELTNCIQECCRSGVAFHNTAAGPALLRLAISAACSGSNFVNRSLPLTMLGDVFENQTSAQAEQLFTLVEDSISQLARLLVNDQGVAGSERYIIIKVHALIFFYLKRLILCKAFNALLKRLCRSSQLVLAGRILVFLSSVFPLSEPSGLNKKGAFNTENTTAYETEEELSAAAAGAGAAAAVAAAAATAHHVSGESTMGDDDIDGDAVADTSGGTECSVDAAFYQTLWSSQRYFREPLLLQVMHAVYFISLQLILSTEHDRV